MANYKNTSRVWTVIMVISIGLLSAGCLLNKANDAFSHEHLNPLLGKDKEIVLENLNLDPQEDAVLEGEGDFQETYTLKEPFKVNGKESAISITFWNDMMLSYDYTFSNIEDGFNYAKQIREKLGEKYGDPTTYPILENRFDKIDDIEDIKAYSFGSGWFEEWELGNSKDIIERLLDGIEAHKIYSEPREMKIKFFVEIRPNESLLVGVGYSARYRDGLMDDED